MANEQSYSNNGQHFTVTHDLFNQPELDIYAQMMYIVLRSYQTESAIPALSDMARKGRMDLKQAIKAMQSLVDQKMITHKLFQQLVGPFNDDRLSWSAKGLLAYCREHPQAKLPDLLALSNQSSEDEQVIRRAIGELSETGYLEELPELKRAVG
ncbi:hypothetical protein IDH44_16840 [Paenibacillus sp. IB182496]|uniref:Uncharacterized protein n=1 Tax=Paenibacillus sabuli TaxID=2772509 RepID=A0A927BU53_9BACL|nr:hypothetical protein [Paenibacillus sabuli]MBD2846866.1 hypothetical protein [Paenibacillus sabuli]